VDLSTFIVFSVFCLVDDQLKYRGPLRKRGPAPKLSDAEVLTIEIVGEFLGLDTDKALHRYFPKALRGGVVPRPQSRPSHHLRQAGGKPVEAQGRALARASASRSPQPDFRHLRLDALAGVPLCSRLPLPPL
jgi:hypothetical protein